jgi:hypothetical protein
MNLREALLRLTAPVICAATLFAQAPRIPPAPAASSSLTTVIQTYCVNCHSPSGTDAAGRPLGVLDPSRLSADPDVWERSLRQLRARTMPPAGSPRPDPATFETATASLAAVLDRGQEGKTNRLDGMEFATRLAAFVWSGAPDQPLLDEAKRGGLNDPTVLERQVRRMLSDPKAKALVTGFFGPWLGIDQLATAKPDPQVFPEFDSALREGLQRETELFIESQLQEDRHAVELWTADYSYLNERLAQHYGIPNVSGPEFRRVTWKGAERAGLLGQGSILMLTSNVSSHNTTGAPYTSPPIRGAWIRTHFLGVNPPQPLPSIPPLQAGVPFINQLRALPASPCTNCHRNFVPSGYALENFDPLGRWRTGEAGGPVDTSGSLVDGTTFKGPAELRRALLERSDAFLTTVTERLLAYAVDGKPAISRPTPPERMPAVRAVLREAASENYRWSALLAGIARSPEFQTAATHIGP